MHGLGVTIPSSPGYPVDYTGPILPTYVGTWATDLLADNWVVYYPSHPEEGIASGTVGGALYNDVSSDPGYGSRYLNTVLHLWDHVVVDIHTRWPGKAIAIGGLSQGGYYTLQILANRMSTVIGGIAHIPATIWSNVNSAFTPPVTFSAITTTGMDAGAHILDSCTVPVMVSYGTNDIAVGYNTAGTGGTPVSNTDSIITNAVAAGRPVTRNATTDSHSMSAGDVTTFMSYTTGTLDPLR